VRRPDRELARLLGHPTIDDAELTERFGHDYHRSVMTLAPLVVYGRRV
jgi:hypothetical protein